MDIDDRKRAEERMRNENVALREDIDRFSMFGDIVGSSSALQNVLTQVCDDRKRPPGSEGHFARLHHL